MRQIDMNNQEGFTIIELLIATVVFAMVLLLLATGVIAVTREYLKGIVETQTQNVARNLEDSIAQAIQFNGSTVQTASNGGSTGSVCVGLTKYSYLLNGEVEDNPDSTKPYQTYHGLLKKTFTSCVPSTPVESLPMSTATLGSGETELLSANMRLENFDVCKVTGTTGTYNINVRVVYGDNDLFLQPGSTETDDCNNTVTVHQCNGSFATLLGGQFCAVSELDTTVDQRIQ